MITMTIETRIQQLVTKEVDSTKLTAAAVAGDSKIYALTGRNDWAPSEYVYGALSEVGATYGAYTILISWDKEEYLDKAKLMLEAYNQAVRDFKELPLPDESSNPEFGDDVATTEYWNPYLNENMPYFMSKY